MKRWIGMIAAVLALSILLCACGKPNIRPLSDIFSKMKAEVSVSDMVEFTSVSDLDRFYGIAADDVAEFAGGVNSSGVQQEEIVLIKATGSDASQRISTALTNRMTSKLNENKDYNPEQYAMIEKCTVDTDGLYVSMIISENADVLKKIFKETIG